MSDYYRRRLHAQCGSLINKGFDRQCCVASDCTCNPENACDSEVVVGGANACQAVSA